MPKFLIEVSHDSSAKSCSQAIQIFKETGSHFLSQSYWGCSDDVHKAWIIMDLDKKEDALSVVPPWYQDKASVITLTQEAFDEKEPAHHKD